MLKKFIEFFKQKEGSILVESALLMPVLAAMLLLSVETSRYILVQQKADRVSATIGDLLARVEDPQTAINDVINVTSHIMAPFDLGTNSAVVTSVVTRPAGENETIVFQFRGAGSSSEASRIGVENGTPTFPENFVLNDNETVVVTEFFFTYEPWFDFSFWSDIPLYTSAFHKPRLQNLSLLEG